MDIKTDAHKTVMRDRSLIFLDIEGTGLEIQKHEIIEIGALKVSPKRPFKILEELDLKVKPEHLELADKEALKIVGFSKEKWGSAVNLKEALDQLDRFAENGVLVGFNVTYDWAMLDKAYRSLGRYDPFYYHRLDVMSMAYMKLFSKRSLKRFSLGQLTKFFKITQQIKHQALDDARATYLVFKALFELN
ncbi:MAG: 3'-5' exonuclease [Patescibacteria group bacterium]|nr:3'-5' exonuclease [Patescibacteria group bacterium]